MSNIFLTFFALILLYCCPSKAFGQKNLVQLESGLVAGKATNDSSVKAYLGIPFAAPPTGNLRWKEPQPIEPWRDVLAADTMPAGCIQHVAGSRLPWSEEFMHQGEISEDCLYLNVWTAATADEKLPVMVYIYGGGFNEGSNSVAVYDGEALARKGVVTVVINYRVGILGFMTHPELTAESPHKASGNYGLLDQVAALQWIQNNIAFFGGDPEQVTIFGQSAGGMSVALLMQSALAKGLFARAIIQSGPGLFPSSMLSGGTLSEGEQRGVKFAELKGAASLAALRALTPEQLMAPVKGAPRFGPIEDGYLNRSDNANTEQVPVMNGFTADDLGAGGSFGPPRKATIAAFEQDAHRLYGDHADTFLSLYRAASDADVPALRKTSGRDRAKVSVYLWAAQQNQMSEDIFTYYFDRAIPWPEHPEFGAFHTGEVPYVFDNLKFLERPWEDVDHKVADQMSAYWTNFAKSGNPNGRDIPDWEGYKQGEFTTMGIGARMGQMQIAEPAKVEFWKTILEGESHDTP